MLCGNSRLRGENEDGDSGIEGEFGRFDDTSYTMWVVTLMLLRSKMWMRMKMVMDVGQVELRGGGVRRIG